MAHANWRIEAEHVYGFFPGGDPRKFHPDAETCTPEEIEAHRLACAAWDAGNATLEATQGGRVVGSMIVCGGRFGIGTYEIEVSYPPDTRYWRRRQEFHARQGRKLVDWLVTHERQRRAWRLMVRP